MNTMPDHFFMNPDEATQPMFVFSEYYSPGETIWHAHQRAQLIYASEGLLTVKTHTGLWIVPPQRAVWILPNVMHQCLSQTGFWLRTLYIDESIIELPPTCCVIHVDDLLRELLITASSFGSNYASVGAESRLMQVLLDRLPLQQITSLHLPRARDPRLVHLMNLLEMHPANTETLEQLSSQCGLSSRTAARLFIHETGLTFGMWRQQLRLLTAITKLVQGMNVTNVAFDIGYQDVSAFIAAFKQAFGKTPAQFRMAFCVQHAATGDKK